MLSKLIDKRWVHILLSVLFAVLFWFFVRGIEDPVQTKTIRLIPVTLSGENVLENQGLTVGDLSHDTIEISVRGNISVLDQLNRNNITATADVSKLASEGIFETSYTVNLPTNINLNGAVVEARTPQQIAVTVNKLYTQVFPVEFSFVGSVADGFQTGTATINPETVTISGPIEQVSKIHRVVATLEREALDDRFSGELPLTLKDENGENLNHLDVKLSAETVFVTLPVVVVREIPLTVNLLSGGGAKAGDSNVTSDIFPKTITVSGAEEDMLALREISLGSVDLSKVVGTNAVNFPINLDTALENVSGITEATVTVTISGLYTATFDVTNIEVLNTPDGYQAERVTQVQKVVVRGSSEALEQIDASQIRIVADLSGVTAAGSTSVPVKVYLDASNDVGVIGDYSIVVNITRG